MRREESPRPTLKRLTQTRFSVCEFSILQNTTTDKIRGTETYSTPENHNRHSVEQNVQHTEHP